MRVFNFLYIYFFYCLIPSYLISQPIQESNITIRYIQRLPEIDYVINSFNPAIEGWPSSGEQVIWRAFVKNWSQTNYEAIDYLWQINGNTIDSGTLSLNAGEEKSVDLGWEWKFERHEIELILDPSDLLPDVNSSLLVFSNAISVAFYAEQPIYDEFNKLWEVWLQKEINKFNEMLINAKFPETPEGVNDRVRIDDFIIVADGELENSVIPERDNYKVDLVWGFPKQTRNFVSVSIFNHDVQNSVIHELGHARYLIDVYGFDISSLDIINITENGQKIAGSKFIPDLNIINRNGILEHIYFYTSYKGLMNTQWDSLDSYSAAALNLMSGYRALDGNYNGSVKLGYFINDIPEKNILIVKDATGNPLSGALIKIYQSVPNPNSQKLYSKLFDDIPDIEVTTDQNGHADIGNNPFGAEIVHHEIDGSNTSIIIRVEHNNKVGYSFLESGKFNMEFWKGNTAAGFYEITPLLYSSVTGIEHVTDYLPTEFKLMQNYPNPFNPSTQIEFSIDKNKFVSLIVFDLQGREIKKLVNKTITRGSYKVEFNAEELTSGVYIYQLITDEKVLSKKMIFLK